MKKTAWYLLTVFLLVAASLAAQNVPVQVGEKPLLAVVPFSGGEGDDGETIAELFSGSKELAQVFRIYPRTSITFGIDEEWNVQKYVVSNKEYRNKLLDMGINYVVAGDITRLGEQNLLVISIIDIEKLVQIAGDIQIFEKPREIEGKLPEMTRNIINGAKIDWTNKPKLAVVNPRLRDNANPEAANVLGEILGIEITRTGKYAVYPRNTTLEAAQTEWDNQRRGAAATTDPQGPGSADRPDHVLGVIARGGEGSVTVTRFNASISNVDTREQVKFTSQAYRNLEDGIKVMRTIAEELTLTEAEAVFLSAKKRLDGIDGKTRRRFAADYKDAEAAYLEAGKALNEGSYEAVQQNIRNMDTALNTIAQKKKKADTSVAAGARFLGDHRRFLSIGAQAGTWFTAPWIAFSPRFTFSVLPYTFFDIACDVGFLHGYEWKVDYDSKYFSLYPSAHLNFFTPFLNRRDELWGGWYLGAGAGQLYAHYEDDANIHSVSLWTFDAVSGFYFGSGHHYFNIAYSFRTDFERMSHKVSAGYTFRFY
jgi:hypothetical protein